MHVEGDPEGPAPRRRSVGRISLPDIRKVCVKFVQPGHAGGMDITRTVETPTPVDQVFGYLSDFTTTEEWDPGTVSTTRRTGDGGLGTVYDNVSSFMGSKTELEYTVTEVVENRRFQLRGTNKTVVATDTMTFEPTPTGGTRVTYHADFQFKGLLGTVAPLLSPVLGLAFKKLGDEAEKGMQDALDRLGAAS